MKDSLRSYPAALGGSKLVTPANGHNRGVGNVILSMPEDQLVGSLERKGLVRALDRGISGPRNDCARNCSTHVLIGHKPRLDPRPLGDKAFTTTCARQLISYLSTHGFNSSLSPKALVSPTTKEFASLVVFLFKMIDENFKFGSKSEDDIPVVFKQLRYPFQISKSSLYAVGSAHTWPYLLAALIWLVHMYIYEDDVTKAGNARGHDSNFLEHTRRAYAYFLAGDDKASVALEREFVSAQTEKSRYLAKNIQDLELENSDLNLVLANMVRKNNEAEALLTKGSLLNEAYVYDNSCYAIRHSVENAELNHSHIITCILRNKTSIQDAAVITARMQRFAYIHESDVPPQTKSDLEQGAAESITFALKATRAKVVDNCSKIITSIELDAADWDNDVTFLNDNIRSIRSSFCTGATVDSSSSDQLPSVSVALGMLDSDFASSTRVTIKRIQEGKVQNKWCLDRENLLAQNLRISQNNLEERKITASVLHLNVCRLEHDYVAERSRIQTFLNLLMSELAEMEEQITSLRIYPQNSATDYESVFRERQVARDQCVQRLSQQKLMTQNLMLAALDSLMGHKQQVQDILDTVHGNLHASSLTEQ